MNWAKFVEWIKQPSTLKALVLAAGYAGVQITPEMQGRVVFFAGVIYTGIQFFYESQPRKPACTPADLEATLTTEQIAEIVRLRRAKLDAAKASKA